MDELPILGRGEDRSLQEMMAFYGAPAYVRRARQVQEELEGLLARCRKQRDEWLVLVRVRLGVLQSLAGDWANLRPLLAGEGDLLALKQLAADLNPRLRAPVLPTSSVRALRRALDELRDSIERFNRRWQVFLPTVDLTALNELREGYNRYYLLEKECAVRSARVARQGFARLAPLTTADLEALLPSLPVPRPLA